MLHYAKEQKWNRGTESSSAAPVSDSYSTKGRHTLPRLDTREAGLEQLAPLLRQQDLTNLPRISLTSMNAGSRHTSGGGERPSFSERSQRSRRLNPTQGPYSSERSNTLFRGTVSPVSWKARWETYCSTISIEPMGCASEMHHQHPRRPLTPSTTLRSGRTGRSHACDSALKKELVLPLELVVRILLLRILLLLDERGGRLVRFGGYRRCWLRCPEKRFGRCFPHDGGRSRLGRRRRATGRHGAVEACGGRRKVE